MDKEPCWDISSLLPPQGIKPLKNPTPDLSLTISPQQGSGKQQAEDLRSWRPSSYLRLDIILVLVVVELLALEHEVPLLPVLDNGALLFQPANLQGPLQRVGGAWPGACCLTAHHALGAGCQGREGRAGEDAGGPATPDPSTGPTELR